MDLRMRQNGSCTTDQTNGTKGISKGSLTNQSNNFPPPPPPPPVCTLLTLV